MQSLAVIASSCSVLSTTLHHTVVSLSHCLSHSELLTLREEGDVAETPMELVDEVGSCEAEAI